MYSIICKGFIDGATKAGLDWSVVVNAKSDEGGSEGETEEPKFSASSPANTDPVSMTVGTPGTFVVTAENAPTTVQYVWYATSEIVDAAGGGVQTVYAVVEGATSTRCTYTPTSADTKSLMCLAYRGTAPDPATESFDSMIGQVCWQLEVTGGETSEVTYTPTTLEDATVGESYAATISIGGVSSIMGGGCNTPTALPPGLSCRVDASTMMAVISGTPTTAGTYTFPLYVKIDRSTEYTGDITITVKKSSGGEEGGGGSEEGGTTGGDPAIATYSPTPAMEYWTSNGVTQTDSDAYITMKIGQRTNLTVNVANADGVRYSWNNPDTLNPIDCSAATYEYRHEGGESPVRVQVVAYIFATGREICKVIWRFDGNEQGDPEEDTTTEKDYLPILADSNEAMAIALENRVSLRLGAFSKPIVRKNGAALSGITVQPVGATPGDVNVSSEGVVSGTMTEGLVGETLTLETVWADGPSSYVMTNVLTFAKRTADNTTPYLAGGALYDSKLGGLVLEPGATLKFNPAESDMIFYGYRLYMPKAGEDKVRFELTGSRDANAGAYNLSARYMGDDDPMNVIEIVPQPGDTANYRVYRGAEQALMFEAVATPDAGDIIWTEDENPSTMNGIRGTTFSQKFAAQGGYRSYVYSLTSGAYTWSRDTANTFDATVGTRELMQASYRVGASDVSAPVEIGFPFPCGTNFISKVNVGANSVAFGDYMVVLQDKGFLAFLTTLSHIYIDRQNDSFTVRYGEFASVTLTPDGKIRVAFGPAADTRYGDDPQVPLYWLHDGSVYGLDFSSAEPYAGSNDVIITPSCPPGLRLEGDTLTGVPLVAGIYTVNVKVVANGNFEMTRAFTVAICNGRLTEDTPVITVTKQPESDSDGYVHLDLNATAEFAASVADGNQMRWTLDGTPLEVPGDTYTLTAPATRSLDAAGAKIHCLAIEADDGTGRWNWSVRKSWQIVYNRAVYIDAAREDTSSTGGATEDGTTTGGTGETRSAPDSGAQTADGLTPETAFGEFPDDLFKYLLNGDEVIVAAGTYTKPIDFLANTAQVTIRPSDDNAKPMIDLTDNDKGYTRCFRQGYYSVEVGKSGTYEQIYQPCTAATVQNFVFKGGAIEDDEHDEYAMQLYPETSVNYYGVAGGGVFGGTFQYCHIKDCSAKDYGGGAYGATLIGCTVTGNAAGNKNNDDILQEVLGGGVYGGYADTCNISTNSVRGYKTQVYCLYDGAGTYDAEVRNSFVWDNFIDSGSTSSRTASDAKGGENGVVIHTEEKLPTEQRLEDHKDPIPTDGTKVVYKSESEAQSAAAKQVISISTEVAKSILDQKAYEDLFDIKPVETSEGSGEYVNKPVLKEEVAEVVETQLDNALTGDANGDPQSVEELQAELTPDTQVMEKTLKTTTPGLYYALEFSSDMSAGSFKGERHLATGSGSIKLKATLLQTSSGFWRVNVYLTPDGD